MGLAGPRTHRIRPIKVDFERARQLKLEGIGVAMKGVAIDHMRPHAIPSVPMSSQNNVFTHRIAATQCPDESKAAIQCCSSCGMLAEHIQYGRAFMVVYLVERTVFWKH